MPEYSMVVRGQKRITEMGGYKIERQRRAVSL